MSFPSELKGRRIGEIANHAGAKSKVHDLRVAKRKILSFENANASVFATGSHVREQCRHERQTFSRLA